MNVTFRWAQRLLRIARVEPVSEPAVSTLQTFFAGVRWSEDLQADGRATLRHS